MTHIPVMLDEVVHYFSQANLKVFFDGTLGNGGHAEAILRSHPEIELFIGCDKDPKALFTAKKRLCFWEKKITLMQGNFADLDQMLQSVEREKADGFFLI